MSFFVLALLSAVLPFLVSLYFYQREQCSVWTVVIAPVIGLFIFATLIVVLVLSSRDM